MSDTTKKKSLDLAYAALQNADEESVLAALERIEQDGDAHAIRPLLLALVRSNSTRVQQRITGMMNTVKAPDAATELLALLDDPAFKTVRTTILAAFWNAGIDVRDHLEPFVRIALEGSAEESFESLTVIENQEIWPEKATRTALTEVREAAASEPTTYKASILKDLVGVLEYRLGIEDAGS